MTIPLIAQIFQDIDEAPHVDRLRVINRQSRGVFAPEGSLDGAHGLLAMSAQLNQIHDKIICRTIWLAEAELKKQGHLPPCAYTFVLFGSGGRSERSALSDQDNGIIYEDLAPERSQDTEQYFKKLGEAIEASLQAIGYPPCAGGVTCGQPAWRGPVAFWTNRLDKWSEAPIWEHARYMLIVADMRPVYGEGRLAAAVSDHFRTCLGGNSALVDAMRENVRYRKPGTGFFGNLLKIRYGEHAGGVEIKYALYIPLVNAVRLLTVVHGIEAISTIERIRQLEGAGILPRPFASLVLQRFAETIGLRAMIAADEWDRRLESSGIVKADRLTKRLQSQVKGCFSTAKKLHQFAQAQVKQMKQDDFP
ncbi:DUF294 nucleotidyltransferase-like domain-containing protein [Brevibacillus massiliensis]|jgi:CBS domain-containing protein|uniref:DUF294 nucleotidyltransferase-like domain-containing protein n=1 Tax=Brevibacillus massiliensis TaxID=1118054 RepID=UPI00031E6A83|nr:DUF294 nucleotidyltransferase-like domain-containing protein [Brevibacillus massiliensis]